MDRPALNLNEYSAAKVTEEQVRETLHKCQRAARLLQNKDFITWRADVERGKERQVRRLIANSDVGDRARGMILAVEKLYSELETQASQIEEMARRLETYEQRNIQPVDRRNWLR